MSTKLTHKDKDEIINKLSAEVAAQRAEISALRVQLEAAKQPQVTCAEPLAQRYPLIDGLGRRYRIEQRGGRAPIKCYMPGA